MRMLRGLGIAAGVAMALVVQVSVLPHLAWRGIVPDLGLLVVVAAGLARDERFAMVVGFGTGLLLDLTPPADHMAGRWTLALVIVGYVAGLARQEAPPTRPALAAMVAVSSVVGSSVFALTGLVLGDLGTGTADALVVVLVAAFMDVVVGLLVVPPLVRLLSPPTVARLLPVPHRDPVEAG
ncbi:MAG: rod shape-determining protein MreD [Nocardioidaceae bacterium]|nr:rod shape-determining protein MreD [Nocardioidaceae bacterium]